MLLLKQGILLLLMLLLMLLLRLLLRRLWLKTLLVSHRGTRELVRELRLLRRLFG